MKLMSGISAGSQNRAVQFVLSGHVQAVGYRPFVYRLANVLSISGWVENRVGQVVIHAEGDSHQLEIFQQALIDQAPAAADVVFKKIEAVDYQQYKGFTICESASSGETDIRIISDLAVCRDCLDELNNPDSRYYNYPFISCTQCGPRYTVIKDLPYDRANTTLKHFHLCEACYTDYKDTGDRRFHAETIACAECGPALCFDYAGNRYISERALSACVEALREGKIVAVKGIGGYHLMCDARNDQSVQLLRERKQRWHKPFAIMISSRLQSPVNEVIQNDPCLNSLINKPSRPIVLVNKPQDTGLSIHISPGLSEIGVMRPYSPLHHLLLEKCGFALVATSANISGEPVLTDQEDVELRLSNVADAFLHHNRPIQRPADDPLYRVIDHQARPLRIGRGNAPLELDLSFCLSTPVLAVGGHMKNTIALAWENRIVISPHIGDLDSLRSQQVFTQVINDLQTLYQVKAEKIICDANHSYNSSRWAHKQDLPITQIFHHHAHASVIAGEFPEVKNWLVFAWDGIGLGEDNMLWGGEAFLGDAGHWQHVASIEPFYLPGGDKASREPWRSAAALCWQSDTPWHVLNTIKDSDLLYDAWKKRHNCYATSSVGRLFDAAAAIINGDLYISYEAQSAMQLESLVDPSYAECIILPLITDLDGILRADWKPLIEPLMDSSISQGQRAALFHNSMVSALVDQAIRLREHYGDFVVGLTGGVFQNRVLAENAIKALKYKGFSVYMPENIPLNDAGICYGQVVEAFKNLPDI